MRVHVFCMGFDTCIMSYTQHHRILQNSFTAQKRPMSHLSNSFPFLLATTYLLLVSITLPLPIFQIFEIIYCVSFSYWLLLLNIMHLMSFCVLLWFNSSLLLLLNDTVLYRYTIACISIHLDFFQVLGNYKYNWISICVQFLFMCS